MYFGSSVSVRMCVYILYDREGYVMPFKSINENKLWIKHKNKTSLPDTEALILDVVVNKLCDSKNTF